MYAGTIAVIIAGLIGLLAMAFGVEGDEPMGADIVPVVIPPMPNYAPLSEVTWEDFHADAYQEYADAFDDYFNAIEYKRAKNGASMVRRPGDKSFRFVKKGK
jgi:hypothetical protein